MNIYAASSPEGGPSMFSLSHNYGKQFLFILLAGAIGLVILLLDTRLLEFFSYGVFGVTCVLLVVVLVVGRTVNGAQGWIDVGMFKLQPAEFAKVGVAMAIARYGSRYNFSLKRITDRLVVLALLALPALLILLQPDLGSVLVFSAFLLVLFREGLSGLVLVVGGLLLVIGVAALLVPTPYLLATLAALGLISWWFVYKRTNTLTHLVLVGLFCGFSLSVDFIVSEVLKPHQQKRIVSLFDPARDPQGTGYNVIQSKIAIGSGGFFGKGFLQGTQTKFDFVPMQDTDFIFCTIGEEYGWLGSTVLLGLYFILLSRLLYLAEETRTRYGRILGYSVACILFVHLAINVGMALGLTPVVGIPLPFFSYGGSALISFTVLLALLLNHHANRVNVLVGSH